MARLRRGTSLWLDQDDGPPLIAPPLGGDRDVDVVIVGGGITGCVTAYRLARHGARLGAGISSRWLSPDRLRALTGIEGSGADDPGCVET